MSSHIDPKVNDEFEKWLNEKYGGYGKVKATRGKRHDFLGMTFLFSSQGKVKIDMISYVNDMLDSFSEPITGKARTPAAEDLFAEGTGDKLDKE